MLTRPTLGSIHWVHFVAFLSPPTKIDSGDMDGESNLVDAFDASDTDIPFDLKRIPASTPVHVSIIFLYQCAVLMYTNPRTSIHVHTVHKHKIHTYYMQCVYTVYMRARGKCHFLYRIKI